MAQDQENTIAGLYHSLETRRSPFLDRGRDCAKYTIPSLLPPEGNTGADSLYKPFQSVGSRGVNNIASKLLLTLMPPNTPFWRNDIDPKLMNQLEDQPEAKTELEEALVAYDRSALRSIEAEGDRPVIFEALKQLVTTGNVLVHDDMDEGLRMFPLDSYVVRLDPRGRLIECVVKESFDTASLPEEAQALVNADQKMGDLPVIDVFTHIMRNPDPKASAGMYWLVRQEVGGQEIPGSQGSYRKDELPWIPLRLTHIPGESYGRGYVEELIGDLRSLENLYQAMVEGSAIMAKVLLMVRPNGVTSPRRLAGAKNGDVVTGDVNDVAALQVEKRGDFSTVLQTIQIIERRLDLAFLNHSAVQRDAERVTAAEIRFMAQELEDALGGVYSSLSQTFQVPYIQLKLKKYTKSKKLPTLPQEAVQMTIVTGFEALGRGHDRLKLVDYIGTLAQLGGPEVIASYVNVGELAKRLAIADGIDVGGLIKTQEEIQQEQQLAQAGQLGQNIAPELVRQVGGALQAQQNTGPPQS